MLDSALIGWVLCSNISLVYVKLKGMVAGAQGKSWSLQGPHEKDLIEDKDCKHNNGMLYSSGFIFLHADIIRIKVIDLVITPYVVLT